MSFTVAVKYRHRPVQLCGLYETRKEAQKNAKELREGWSTSRLASRVPSSIRVREVTDEKFWEGLKA